MPIDISIHTLAEKAAGTNQLELDPAKKVINSSLHVAVIEGGTMAGNTSLIVLLKDANGDTHYAECTLAEWNALSSAIKGAQLRFEDGRTRNN